ncbi:hypothetical protein GT347_08170 [Xylophilus rhododendri]|uniref:Toxin CcdB n=1 Tax=Xylophilus rhododendri TaxID=2697032 RepID=A0A857J4L2_9BURK|nr:hypothetical protein GT347_08170 [Xylophilus rhododendri]
MARFHVYRNAEGQGYLLDIQADLLGHLNTSVVVPLLPLPFAPSPARMLNPISAPARASRHGHHGGQPDQRAAMRFHDEGVHVDRRAPRLRFLGHEVEIGLVTGLTEGLALAHRLAYQFPGEIQRLETVEGQRAEIVLTELAVAAFGADDLHGEGAHGPVRQRDEVVTRVGQLAGVERDRTGGPGAVLEFGAAPFEPEGLPLGREGGGCGGDEESSRCE